MSKQREELKAKLLSEAETAIDKMLSDQRMSQHMHINDIEDLIGDTEGAFRESVLRELMSVQDGTSPACGDCGGRLRNKGKRKRRVLTLRGEAEIERKYYQCQDCGKGFFPLDEQLGLNGSGFSPTFAKHMVWLSGILPYERCVEVFERLAGPYVSPASIWRQGQRYGEKLQTYVEGQREAVSPERIELPDARHDHEHRKGLSMDGGMVNIRREGWRELKVGAVFDVEQRLERNPQTGALEEMAHGVNVRYSAVLGTKDKFAPALWALALAHDLPTARERSVVADGALWIWDVAEEVCPDGRQVLDWFHAVEHLADAAAALYPDEHDAKKRKRWLKTYKNHLYLGQIHKIIRVLRKRGLAQQSRYFERHKDRMQYLEFRKKGIPIGSGTVESGVKQFKQRLSASGMRWNADGANRMVLIRTAILSHEFDDLWDKVA